MSLSSTSTIKGQLTTSLGEKASRYFETLNQFVTGKISRTEFEEGVLQILDSPSLIQLHNALIISLFDATTYHRRLLTPPPDLPKPPPRKRRRTLPYGPGSDELLKSSRLKGWAVSIGRRERDRLKTLQSAPLAPELSRPRQDTDEIFRERGVVLLPERGENPGSRVSIHLASLSRGPTLQHIADRINLISAQHNLNMPSKSVSSLMMLAYEAKLKQLITQALSLTSSSHAITSINPSKVHSHNNVLSSSSFDTLFNLSPAVLPNQSAAAMRLALGDNESFDDEDVVLLKDREVRDQRWQIFALMGERSAIKDALRTLR